MQVVKHLRIFILVLLAVLLPIRGAVAASMLCPEGEGAPTTQRVAEQGHHGMQAGEAMQATPESHADHATAHAHTSTDAADDNACSSDHASTCHLCASGCCMVSMVGFARPLGQLGLPSVVKFPALNAATLAFQSGGQDRPPRTF